MNLFNSNPSQRRIITVCLCRESHTFTKQSLVSDIAQTFKILVWFAPSTILMKILLQKLWEKKVEWDKEVPQQVKDKHHSGEVNFHSSRTSPSRCYFRPRGTIASMNSTGSHMLPKKPTQLSCTYELCMTQDLLQSL